MRNVLGELKVAHLVSKVRGWGLDPFELVRMITCVPGDALAAAPIQLDRLAEEWATGSISAARAAYCSFAIASPHGQNAYDVTWEGQAAYDGRCKPIVERRLAEASQNLAGLINAIWPET